MLAAAKRKDWRSAYLNANGLSMTEMLSGFAELPRPLLLELKGAGATFGGSIDLPRVQYAVQVVETRTLPAVAPGDLAATGQVDVARKFLLSAPSAVPSPSGGISFAPWMRIDFAPRSTTFRDSCVRWRARALGLTLTGTCCALHRG